MKKHNWRTFERFIRRRAKPHLTRALAISAVACVGATRGARGEEAPPSTMPEVVVTGRQTTYKPKTAVSPKYTQPLLDTPQSVTVVPKEVLEDRGVTTFRDAVRNAPGISVAAGEAGAQGDNLTVRGFSARSDIFRDGMRDFGSYYRDPFDMEQIDVLKGPASVNFGRGSTGGVVNQVSKTPHLQPYNEATLSFGTDKTKRTVVDINQPLPDLGETAAFRLNAMVHDSEVAGRDIGKNSRYGFAPSLALGLGTPTRLTLDYYHQSENDVPDYGLPFLLSRPAPVDMSNYYGFKDHNYLKAKADIVTTKVEHDMNDHLNLRDQVRYANYRRDVQITEPRIPSTVVSTTPVNSIQVTRGQIASNSTETFLENQLDVTGKFKTGFVDHTLVTGMEIGQETSDPERPTINGVPSTSLVSPKTNDAYTATSAPITSRVHTFAHSLAAYLMDTLKWGPYWELTGGVRWDRFSVDYNQSITPQTAFNRVDEFVSSRGSLVYKPIPTGSIYASYGTSFNPSAEQLSLSASNANLDPEKSKTYEVGTKWDLFGGGLTLSGALFRDEKTNARTIDPNNSLLNVLSGKHRVDGVEVAAAGKVAEAWQIFAGYAFLDSQVVESNNPLEEGNPIANAPKHTVNIWNTYELPWRKIQLGAGANAVSKRTASNARDANTGLLREVPGYMTFDAMVKVPVSGKINIQLNLYNILDKDYYDTIHPSHIIPGAGRTLLVSTSIEF